MPAGVVAAVAAAATVAGTIGVGGTAVSTILLVAGSVLAYMAQQSGSLPQDQTGIRENTASTANALPVVYGTTRIGMNVVDVQVHPDSRDRRALFLVGALCVGSEDGNGIAGIDEIHFWDEEAFNAAGNVDERWIPSSDLEESRMVWTENDAAVVVRKYLGTDSQQVEEILNDNFPDRWPTSSRLRGIAYLAFGIIFYRDLFGRGIPNITANVRGQRVFDPRDSQWKFSDNPALCIRDYLTSKRYGMGVPLSDIDEDSFIEMANLYDEFVSTPGGVEKQFTCNGWLSTGASLQANLNRLLSSARAEIVYQKGVFRLITRTVQIPSGIHLNEDNIIGNWNLTRLGVRDTANKVIARFVDGDDDLQNVAEVEWPEADQVNDFLENDGGIENTKQIDLPMTQSYYMAQRIGIVLLKESRQDALVEVTCDESLLETQVGDIVEVSHQTPGFSNKEFWVHSVAILPDRKVRLALQEYVESAYSLDPQDLRDPPPGTDLPDILHVEPPTELVLDNSPIKLSNGEVLPRIFVEWTRPEEPFLDHVDVQFRHDESSEWDNVSRIDADELKDNNKQNAYILGLQDGELYHIRVSAVSTIGARSEWITDSIETSIADPLPFEAFTVNIEQKDPSRPILTLTEMSDDVAVGPFEIRWREIHSGFIRREFSEWLPSPVEVRLIVRFGAVRVIAEIRDLGRIVDGSPVEGVPAETTFVWGEEPADSIPEEDRDRGGPGGVPDFPVWVEPIRTRDGITIIDDLRIGPELRYPNDQPLITIPPRTDRLRQDGTANENFRQNDSTFSLNLAKGLERGVCFDGVGEVFSVHRNHPPEIIFGEGGGISVHSSLTPPYGNLYRAVNISATGFTPELKLVELVGSIEQRTISSWSSGDDLQLEATKTQSIESWNAQYILRHFVQVSGNEIFGDCFGQSMVVGYYVNRGSGWDLIATSTYSASCETFAADINRTITVDGMTQNTMFGISLVSGVGIVSQPNTGNAVTWTEATTAGQESATPTGAEGVPWEAKI